MSALSGLGQLQMSGLTEHREQLQQYKALIT